MAKEYSKCHLCGHTVPTGHPCLNCVSKKRMKEKDKVIIPDQITEYVKILRLQKNDILVIQDDNILNEEPEALDCLCKKLKEQFRKDDNIQIMILSNDAKVMVIRSEDEK